LDNKGKWKMKKINYKEIIYPKIGTVYYSIGHVVWGRTWGNTIADKANFDSGNYFPTQEEADSEFEWRILNTQILNTIALLNKEDNDWVADWTNNDQEKYCFFWNGIDDTFNFTSHYIRFYYINNGYVSRHAGERLLTLYTKEEFKFWLTKENDNETT